LQPGYGHLVDSNCKTEEGNPKVDIISNHLYNLQELLRISGDGYFQNRIDDFSFEISLSINQKGDISITFKIPHISLIIEKN
jgi:hypothetical protein